MKELLKIGLAAFVALLSVSLLSSCKDEGIGYDNHVLVTVINNTGDNLNNFRVAFYDNGLKEITEEKGILLQNGATASFDVPKGTYTYFFSWDNQQNVRLYSPSYFYSSTQNVILTQNGFDLKITNGLEYEMFNLCAEFFAADNTKLSETVIGNGTLTSNASAALITIPQGTARYFFTWTDKKEEHVYYSKEYNWATTSEVTIIADDVQQEAPTTQGPSYNEGFNLIVTNKESTVMKDLTVFYFNSWNQLLDTIEVIDLLPEGSSVIKVPDNTVIYYFCWTDNKIVNYSEKYDWNVQHSVVFENLVETKVTNKAQNDLPAFKIIFSDSDNKTVYTYDNLKLDKGATLKFCIPANAATYTYNWENKQGLLRYTDTIDVTTLDHEIKYDGFKLSLINGMPYDIKSANVVFYKIDDGKTKKISEEAVTDVFKKNTGIEINVPKDAEFYYINWQDTDKKEHYTTTFKWQTTWVVTIDNDGQDIPPVKFEEVK